MDKNQERNLEAISHIDDEIIDRNTRKRVSLANRKGKKLPPRKWYIIGGSLVAAIAVVLTTVLILVNVLAKQVPIYTGMTVSNQLPTVQASSGSVTVLDLSTPGKGSWSGDYDRDHGDLSDPFEKPLKDSLTVVGAGEERYYAKPGEDIYITVHIDNPDKFEILSFTLNGEKYTSYMFEAGSDLENLILKVNVGAAEGVVEYTIDAIKYVDGTEIKDVRMEGDQTVEVGVYTEKQPTANIKSETVGFNSLSFTVAAEDLMDLVGDSEGRLQAVLYDGERIIGVKDINTKGDTAVTFENLQTNTLYQYAVIAVYDALDGTGMNTYILWQKGFYTKAPVLFDDVSTDKVGVSFGFKWDDTVTDKSLTSLTLYRGDAKVRDVALFATALDGLTPDTAYTLIATYHHGGKAESIRLDFTTDPFIYTVKYLLEDLDGNGYTVDQTVESVVAPGAVFAPDVIAYSGFTAPAAQQKTASTEDAAPVIEYRYTRNSYTVILSDSGSDTLRSLKYGAPLPTPEKEGYTFIGWFSDDVQITAVPAASMTVYARWAGEATAADLLYSGVGRITIEGLKNKALTDVVIPAYINDAPVVSIGAEAFADNDWLHSVTLPATVTTIGAAAFEGCTALDTVTLSTGLTSVGTNAFGNCTALSAVIVDGTLGDWAKINFTDASANPLKLCGNLTVGGVNVLSDTLTVTGAGRIGTYAFAGCTGLTSLIVPDTVTEIGEGAFSGCSGLQSMTVPFVGAVLDAEERSPEWHPFGYIFGTEYYDGCVRTDAIYYITESMSSYYVPSSLRSVTVTGGKITEVSFYDCSMLTSVTLSAGVTAIGDEAFKDCSGLKEIVLPSGLLTIGNSAFSGCTGLTEIVLPSGLLTIGGGAFNGCTGVSELVIPASVTSLGDGLFGDNLVSVTLPATTDLAGAISWGNTSIKTIVINGGTCIPADAFRNCRGVEKIVIPASVTGIGQGAFYGCDALKTLVIPCALQKAHFGSMVITSNGEELSYDYPDALQTVIIAEGTTALDAFEWAEELNTVTTVVLPVTLTSINENAFASYTNLTAICYGGTQTRWETSFGTVSLPTGAKVYDYSATETTTAGMWYYDASGNVVTVPHTTA